MIIKENKWELQLHPSDLTVDFRTWMIYFQYFKSVGPTGAK